MLLGVEAVLSQLPAAGAGGLLHPSRHRVTAPPPTGCEASTFAAGDVALRGWRCRTQVARRGTIIYLHGIADNRPSAEGVIRRFSTKGFDVVAYDSRAHGDSITPDTLRRRMRALGLRWNRPRYVYANKDPHRAQKKGGWFAA